MQISKKYNYWKWRVFWGVSLTYGIFYLCRLNISVALPEIGHKFGSSKALLGGIGSAFFILYSLGQFINGQLGDRVSPRLLILIGLVVSSSLNIAVGFSFSILAILIFWGANGYFQSMAWGPSVKILASWFPLKERGKISGFQAFFYQGGNVASWIIAGYLAQKLGWRWAFFIPAIILLLTGIYFFNQVRNSPGQINLAIPWKNSSPNKQEVKSIFRQSIGNPRILKVAISFFFLSITSYSLLFWLPSYLVSSENSSVSLAAYRSIILPLSGAVSGLFTGWMTDRFFSSKRTPLAIIMLGISLPVIFVFPYVSSINGKLAFIFLLGLLIYGPHMLMVGTIPMDYATERAASSAAGFIDSLGYLGATVGGVGTGLIIDYFSWDKVFILYGISIFLSLFCLFLEKASKRRK